MFEKKEIRDAIKYGAKMSRLYELLSSHGKQGKFFTLEILGLVILVVSATRMHEFLLPSYLVCFGGYIFFEFMAIKFHYTKPFSIAIEEDRYPSTLRLVGEVREIKDIDDFIDKISKYKFNGSDSTVVGVHETEGRSDGIIISLKRSFWCALAMIIHVGLNIALF